jgi:hypothetical protein
MTQFITLNVNVVKLNIALTLQVIRVNIFLWHNGILKNFHKNNIDLINFKLQ